MNVTIPDIAQALAHVGLWLPITVIFCTLAVLWMRRDRSGSDA